MIKTINQSMVFPSIFPCTIHNWLVVWNMNFIFPLGIIIPSDELHHFSEGLVETTNQIGFYRT
jgi:hypothetical protein